MSPQSSYDAVATLLQTCENMLTEYETLAESGAGILSNVTTAIGLYYQYKYTFTLSSGLGGVDTVIEYHDRDIRWWEKWAVWSNGGQVSTERVEHPRRQEALDALEASGTDVSEADEKFDYDATSIRDTVSSVGDFMGGWLTSFNSLNDIVFPEQPDDVATPNVTGWQSPITVDRYARNMSLQFDAHVEVEQVITDLLKKCHEFLDQLSTTLADFAGLVRDQEQWYVDLATDTWGPETFSIQGLIDAIKGIGTGVVEYRRQQDEKATAMIETMLGAVETILTIETLKGRIDGLARSGDPGWPQPNSMGVPEGDSGANDDVVEFQVQYFKDHITTWEDLSSDLQGVASDSSAVPAIETMFLRWPEFGATTSNGLNDLSGHITDTGLQRGKTASATMATMLDATMRNYIEGENLATAHAQRLQDILDG